MPRPTTIAFALCLLGVAIARAQVSAPDSLSLPDALTAIARRGERRFSFEASALADVRVGAASAKTWARLARELTALEVAYRVEADGTVLVARKPPTSPTTVDAPREVVLVVTDGDGPLVGATARLPDGSGAVSDLDGRLKLRLPSSSSVVRVEYLGYRRAELLLDARPTYRRVVLRPDTVVVSGVEVVAALPPRPWRGFGVGDPTRYGARGRPVVLPPGALSGFGFGAAAGASHIDGGGASPAIRGSQGHETRVELDGLPLYYVDHLFGLFSAVNPLSVADVTLHRSHYPVDRGGARGGLMEIATVRPEASGFAAKADPTAAAATAEVYTPFARVLVSGRSSLGNVAEGAAFENSGAAAEPIEPVGSTTSVTARTVPSFTYHDAYARLEVGREASPWSLSLNGYLSRDRYDYVFTNEDLLEDRRVPATLRGGYDEASEWRNAGAGVGIRYEAGALAYALDGYATRYTTELTSGAEFELELPRRTRGRELFANALANEVADRQLGLRIAPRGSGARWQAGVQAQRLRTEGSFVIGERNAFDEAEDDLRVHAYGAGVLALTEGLEADVGLRATYARFLDEAWLSPRVALAQRVLAGAKGSSELTAGYSYTRQTLANLQHENQFGQTYDLLVLEVPSAPVVAAAHTGSVGVRHERANALLSVEGYYRALPGVLASLSTNLGVDGGRDLLSPQPTFLTVAGDGEVVGVDVDARWRQGGWGGSLAYTLARSRQRFDAVDGGDWQRAPDDRRHRFATEQSYRYRSLRATMAYEGASGLVYNDIAEVGGRADRRTLDQEELQRSLPAYHRVDLGLAWTTTLGPCDLELGGRVVNAFDRFNVSQRQYVLGIGRPANNGQAIAVGTDVGLLGRLFLAEVTLRL